MGVIALTHDIDRLSLIEPSVFHGVLSLGRWGVINLCYRLLVKDVSYSAAIPNTHSYLRSLIRMVEIEAEMGVRSTFFVCTRSHWRGRRPSGKMGPSGRAIGYRIKDLACLREFHDAGWEIGLHGVRAFESVELAREEKSTLEDFLSSEVVGHRSHYLYMNEHSIDYLREAGFRYDSSYFRYTPSQAEGFSYPIEFMDSAIIRDFRPICQDITSAIKEIFSLATRKVTVVLWHSNVLGYPFQLEHVYRRFLNAALVQGLRVEPLYSAITTTRR